MRYFPLPESKQLMESNGPVVIGIITEESDNFDRADALMPIVVPPKNLFSKFPIKIFPEEFHSNMPIYRLKKSVPGFEEGACLVFFPLRKTFRATI